MNEVREQRMSSWHRGEFLSEGPPVLRRKKKREEGQYSRVKEEGSRR